MYGGVKMDMDFAKTMALLNGETTESFLQNQLSQSDCAQIDNAIDTLFSGLSLLRWLHGATLTKSWAEALDELRDIVFTYSNQNSATNYARNYVFVHRRKWHVKIVSCHRPDQLINCPPEKFNDWKNDAKLKIQMGIELLKKKFSEFSTPMTKKIPTFQNVPQFNIQLMQERTNEHEHIRERTK